MVFSLGLLVGVQVPGFVDQYAKRVSAHLIEVKRDFAGFQQTADQYFGGSIEALLTHHRASPDAVFQDEARTIGAMHERLKMLTAEFEAMRGPLIRQIAHLLTAPNREMLNETRAEYTYTVPLSPSAIVSGLIGGTLLGLLVDAVWAAVAGIARSRRLSPA